MQMTLVHRHSITKADQVVLACVVIGAVLGSQIGIAGYGNAVAGTLPGAVLGFVIGRQLARANQT